MDENEYIIVFLFVFVISYVQYHAATSLMPSITFF